MYKGRTLVNGAAEVSLTSDITGEDNQRWEIADSNNVVVNAYWFASSSREFRLDTLDDNTVGCNPADDSPDQQWTRGEEK